MLNYVPIRIRRIEWWDEDPPKCQNHPRTKCNRTAYVHSGIKLCTRCCRHRGIESRDIYERIEKRIKSETEHLLHFSGKETVLGDSGSNCCKKVEKTPTDQVTNSKGLNVLFDSNIH